MKLLANKSIQNLYLAIAGVWAVFLPLMLLVLRLGGGPMALVLVFFFGAAASWAALGVYFQKQNACLEQAVAQINAFLSGDTAARIDCDREGELYRLFHSVNALAAVLNAHADNAQREKVFLQNTISDISHQLKTPLAALNIYNGLLQEEAAGQPNAQEFVRLSEQELDRMESLVQNLLKITKLDVGTITLEKDEVRVADMLRELERSFAYRADQERKALILQGAEDVTLLCDRTWLREAMGNLIKNALDHTQAGDTVRIVWNAFPNMVRIAVSDNGCGIHPEDLPHIFKRFYRSRFSKDTQGIGLGLPLAKAIVEAHNGSIEVDSEWGKGSVFTIHFWNPTNL